MADRAALLRVSGPHTPATPVTLRGLRSPSPYQSLAETTQKATPGTAEMVRQSQHVLVATTQTKLVGALLLGFSLVALLEPASPEAGSREQVN